MSEFKEVPPLVLVNFYCRVLSSNSGVELGDVRHMERIRLNDRGVIALQDWLASATGYYPTPKDET